MQGALCIVALGLAHLAELVNQVLRQRCDPARIVPTARSDGGDLHLQSSNIVRVLGLYDVERMVSDQHQIQYYSSGVDVDFLAVALSLNLLGSHVEDCTDLLFMGCDSDLHLGRETEVDDLDRALLTLARGSKLYILRLQIPMNVITLMNITQAVQNGAHDLCSFLFRVHWLPVLGPFLIHGRQLMLPVLHGVLKLLEYGLVFSVCLFISLSGDSPVFGSETA